MVARKFVSCLSNDKWKLKYVVPAGWLILCLCGALLTKPFLLNTNNEFARPVGSPSDLAQQQMEAHFPQLNYSRSNLVLFADDEECFGATAQTPACQHTNVLGPSSGFQQFSFALEDHLRLHYQHRVVISGYFYAVRDGKPDEALAYVSPHNKSTIVPLKFFIGVDAGQVATRVHDFVVKEREIGGSLHGSPLSVTLLGIDAFMGLIQESVEFDMAIADGIALPLSLCVLAATLGSFRLLIIPLVCLPLSALTSFGIMYFFSLGMHIMTSTLSLMMSLLIAFTLDYSLFLLTRFREEVFKNPNDPKENAVVRMLETSGHTCLVSGLTLAAAFLGLLLIPQNVIRGIGLGAGVSVLVILGVILTVLPSLLLMFPEFFSRSKLISWPCKRAQAGAKSTSYTQVAIVVDPLEDAPLEEFATEEPAEAQSRGDMESSRWYRLGKRLVSYPTNMIVIIVVLLCIIPFLVFAFNFPMSTSVDLALPYGSDISSAFHRMSTLFGFGFLNPWKLVIVPPQGTEILSDAFFAGARSIFDEFYAATNTTCASLSSITGARCHDIQPGLYVVCKRSPTALDQCAELLALYDQYASDTAIIATLQFDFDPSGPLGEKVYRKAIDWVASREDVFIAGGDGWDSVFICYQYFPMMIGLTFGAVLLFVGLAFKSLLVPIRSVLTMALTLGFVFGWCTLTYVHGALDWLHFYGLARHDAIIYLPPLVSFSIVAGLALDYDLFLLVRIREYRLQGVRTREAIPRGLYKTGRIVTAAGLIMAIAFSGLLFSKTPAMNLVSFYMVFAVLLDTFVIRTFLVPALFSIGGEYNWFPGNRWMVAPSE